MSDYHAIATVEKRNAVQVAFHFAVPSENNAASKALSACIVQDFAHSGVPVTAVPAHATEHATENAALVAGTKIEYVETVRFDANETNANKLAVIEARWTALNAIVPNRIRDKYKFWGYNGDI